MNTKDTVEALERLKVIQERYTGTATPRNTYDVRADDLAWLINEIELRFARVDPPTTDVEHSEHLWINPVAGVIAHHKAGEAFMLYRRVDPPAAPTRTTIEKFRDLQPGWDSYGARAIAPEAIELALRLAPLLPDWQPVPRSDGGIQFERGDDEICIDVSIADSTAPAAPTEEYDHDDPKHIYHIVFNPSGCDKFYCLKRFDPEQYAVIDTAPPALDEADRRERKTALVDQIVDAVYRSMARYEDGTWFLDNLRAKARVKQLLNNDLAQVKVCERIAAELKSLTLDQVKEKTNGPETHHQRNNTGVRHD